jgi:hypothetical protein
MITLTARLQVGPDDPRLSALGAAYNLGVRRALKLVQNGHSDSQAERTLRKELKPGWSRRWLRSMIVDAKALRASRIELARTELVGFEDRIARLEKRLGKAKRAQDGTAQGYARRRDRLRSRQAELKVIAAGKREPSITFGTKKLLRERQTLTSKRQIADWRSRWNTSRNGSFFVQGDRDRVSGNGALQLDLDADALRICSPLGEFSVGLVGLDRVRSRLGLALTSRSTPCAVRVFYRPEKRAWYAAFTVSEPSAMLVSDRANGALGVDVNPDHLALCLVNGDGNPVLWQKLPLDLSGSTAQNADRIGLAAKAVCDIATLYAVPIVCEQLDFGKARTNLRYLAPRLARLLSSFAYRKILSSIDSRAARCGILLLHISPAWTSVLGQANYAVPYGVSVDQAAACVIARRGLGLRERARPSIPRPAPVDAVRADAKTQGQRLEFQTQRLELFQLQTRQKRLISLAHSLPRKRSSIWGTDGLARDRRRASATTNVIAASRSILPGATRLNLQTRQAGDSTGSCRNPRPQRLHARTGSRIMLAAPGQHQR